MKVEAGCPGRLKVSKYWLCDIGDPFDLAMGPR